MTTTTINRVIAHLEASAAILEQKAEAMAAMNELIKKVLETYR